MTPTHSATVFADGTARVTSPAGERHLLTTSAQDAREQVVAFFTHAAQENGGPIHAVTTDPQGTYHLQVHPSGNIEPLEGSEDTVQDEPATPTVPAPPPVRAVTTAGPVDEVTHPRPAEPSEIHASAPTPALTVLDEAANVSNPPVVAPDSVQVPPTGAVASDQCDITKPTAATAVVTEEGEEDPTLDDLLASRPPARPGPARAGWQGSVRRLSGGLIKPDPGPAEMAHRSAVASVQRSLNGPKTIVVVNPKGGAHKTTASLLIAATFGIHRGGYTLAWDNNETRGTMGWRANPVRHTNTAVDLLRDLDRFAVTSARVGDLDNYVRSQGSAQFDVLASDEDAESSALIDADAFGQLHHTLSRFYRVIVVDTGNNMRATNWQAAVAAADQLVIISTVKEDTAQSAAWLLDGLRSNSGSRRAVKQAITVLTTTSTSPSATDIALSARLHDHFSRRTRAVVDVPYDPALQDGGPIDYDALSPASRAAWLRVTAAIADGL
jgi:putative peptide zinc metalloprotease protein